MATTHNLGYPRIGERRELKKNLETYWQGGISAELLTELAGDLRQRNWRHQDELDLVPVGDFSLYDHVLDTSAMLGNLPTRAVDAGGSLLDQYFRAARGRVRGDSAAGVAAGEMTKWLDTNYHYIAPEFTLDTTFTADAESLTQQLRTLQQLGQIGKPVLLGPLSYLWLGKSKDDSDRLQLLDRLIPAYSAIISSLADAGAEWVQLDEPILVTDLDERWRQALRSCYEQLATSPAKLLLATYFGRLGDNLDLACQLPVAGLHVDASRGFDEAAILAERLPNVRVLSVGAVSGRNVWKTDLSAALDQLEPLAERLGQRLWLAPSCSLLHVPLDLRLEHELDPEIVPWLAFARQKIHEVSLMARALDVGRQAVAGKLEENARDIAARRNSTRVAKPQVKAALQQISNDMLTRAQPYAERSKLQAQRLQLPAFPTTTIGSFPQTPEVRRARRAFRSGKLDATSYESFLHETIQATIAHQEQLGLDVLVHGESERNDMVEYFGEQLDGFVFTQNGWVQSYGSRCVKPPILYGDVTRPQPMTVRHAAFAQSLTDKPVKGMLTGPVTILNWSFVRDDQPRAVTCQQLALAIRQEVLDLERAGVSIIQVDEAALREGLPLRRGEWDEYLRWTVDAFRLAVGAVAPETQIHTHMCYSEFNDIMSAIAEMDADVITIETSRSDMELLDVFETQRYPNAIGPGVYDIHSPNVPTAEDIVERLRLAQRRISSEQLWVNPDCGLKTRRWQEVMPALQSMVQAARQMRQQQPARSLATASR